MLWFGGNQVNDQVILIRQLIIVSEWSGCQVASIQKFVWLAGVLGYEGQIMFIWRSKRAQDRSVCVWGGTPGTPSNSIEHC